jgi:PilZ domain.
MAIPGNGQRRGTRVRAQIPVRVTSLDSDSATFSERCHTLSVNPQGCGVRFSRPLNPGAQIRVDELPGGSSVKARVTSSIRLASKYWVVGICLEKPANLWCMIPSPADWGSLACVPKFFPAS